MAEIATDYGRVTRVVASGYDRARIHGGTLVRGEQRALVVTLAGAAPAGRTITRARWQCDGIAIVMSSARISDDQRQAAVNVLASWPGCSTLKCTMQLDNGESIAQLAVLRVLDGACFTDGQSAVGPTELIATA